MSYDYEFAGLFPFEDLAEQSLQHVARVIGAPVTRGDDGRPRIESGGLAVYALPPEPEAEGDPTDRYLGFMPNQWLIFSPYGSAVREAEASMIRAAASFASVEGFTGALLGEAGWGVDDSLVLVVKNSRVTYNSLWGGWSAEPSYLEAIDDPGQLEEIRFLPPQITE